MSISEFSHQCGSQTCSDCLPSIYETETATPVQAPTENGHCNFISFLAAAQACAVDFHPLVWHPVENLVARGGTADIRQRMMSQQFSFAFKAMSLPRISDDTSSQKDPATKERRAFQALIAEILILTHPSIRNHRNIINLEGVCWEISAEDGKAWPVLMFEKAQFGDLHQFMKSDAGKSLDFQGSLQLCRNIARAIAAMHSGSIIHGDLKPENVLMFADKDGNQIPKVSDFGYSTLVAQEGDLVQLPISRPWNAPEIHHRGGQFELSVAKKMDSYSFGVLCLWILFRSKYEKWTPELRKAYEDGNDSVVAANFLATVENMKEIGKLPDFAQILIAFSEDITDEQRTDLTTFFRRTLISDLDDRSNDFAELLQLLGDQRARTNIEFLIDEPLESLWYNFIRERSEFRRHHGETEEEKAGTRTHVEFQIAAHCVDLIKADFRVRNYIVRCLEQQADSDPCEDCRLNAALQMALCSKLGFAIPRNEQESLGWLAICKRNDLDDEIKRTAIENITKSYRLMRLLAAGLDIELDIGHHYMRFGILEAAEKQTKREIEDMQESLGRNHVSVMHLKHTLSSILEAKGDHTGAEELRRDLQETFEQGGHEMIAPDLNLAITLQHRGKLHQAEELLNRASEKLERRYGKDKDFILVRLKTIQAEVFQEQGRYEMAEKTYREALECDRRLLGSETETTCQLLTGIALSLFHQDKSQEAEKMFKEVAAICKRRLGEGHLVTKRTLQWLADTQFKNGKYDDSEETYRDVLLHARQHFGQDHLETLKVYSGLVAVLNARGKFQEAEAILESISKPIQNMALDDDVEALEVLSKVSLQYLTIGKGVEAEPLMQRTRKEYQRRFGPDHPGFLAAMGDQALALYYAGKLDEAEELYNMVIDPMLETKHPSSANTVNNYALLLTDKGDLERAEKMHRWAWRAERSVHGDDHPAVLSGLNNIGRVLMRQGKLTEAEELFQKVLDARIKLFGHHGFYTLRSYSNLAAVLFLQGKLKDAEASYRHLLEAQEKDLGIHPDVIGTMRNFANVLLGNAKITEGKSMQQRAIEASEKLWGTEHPLTQNCLNDLFSTLRTEALATETQWGKHQQRTEWEKVLRSTNVSTEIPNQSPKAVSKTSSDVWLGAHVPNSFSNITTEVKVTEAELAGSSSTSPRCLFHALPPVALEPTIGKRSDFDCAEHFVTSDVDEQLLLSVKFRRTVKIHSIQLTSLPESNQMAKRPRTVKLFTNRINSMGFEEAEEDPAVQTITINEKDWDEKTGTAVLEMFYVKFQKVSDLVLFVSDGQGDFTRLDRVRIIGK